MNSLDDLLDDASAALDDAVRSAEPTAAPPPSSGGRRTIGTGIAVTLAIVGGVVVLNNNDDSTAPHTVEIADDPTIASTTTTAASAETASDTTPIVESDASDEDSADAIAVTDSEADPGPQLITDTPPAGLVLTAAAIAPGLEAAHAVLESSIYGVDGVDRPGPDDPDLTIVFTEPALMKPPADSPTTVHGDPAMTSEDGGRRMVMFESGDGGIMVLSTTLTEAELVGIAEALVLDPTGRPQLPLTEAPQGLRHLATIQQGIFDEPGSSATPNRAYSEYVGGSRQLTITSRPWTAEAESAMWWADRTSSEPVTVGETEARLNPLGPDGWTLQWPTGDSIIHLIGTGLDRQEMLDAATSVRTADDGEWHVATTTPSVVPAPTGITSIVDASTLVRAVATDLPDGMAIELAADHSDLGTPVWQFEGYLYLESGEADRSEDSRTLSVGVSGNTGTSWTGATVEVAGLTGRLVDFLQDGEQRQSLVFEEDGQEITIGGRDLSSDELIAAAEGIIVARQSAPMPPHLGDWELRDMLLDQQVWQAGSVTVLGHADGATINYRDGDRQLTIASGPRRSLGHEQWLTPYENLTVVDVAGSEGYLRTERSGSMFLTFNYADATIVMSTEGDITTDELLAAAVSLRPAADDEWGVGIP